MDNIDIKDIKDKKGRVIEGTKFDGFYGEHTFNAPGFNEVEKKPELKPEPEPPMLVASTDKLSPTT